MNSNPAPTEADEPDPDAAPPPPEETPDGTVPDEATDPNREPDTFDKVFEHGRQMGF